LGTGDKVLPLSMRKELSKKIKGWQFLEIPGGRNARQESLKDFNALVMEFINRD